MQPIVPRKKRLKPIEALVPPPKRHVPRSRRAKQDGMIQGKMYRAFVLVLVSTGFLIGGIGVRLAYLQVLRHDTYYQSAEYNRIRLIPRPPERGRIVDRNGTLLASSQLSHSIFIWPLTQPQLDWPPIIEQLSRYIDVPAAEITARIERAGYRSPLPVRIRRNVSPETVTAVLERSTELPGVIVQPETVRYYPHGELFAHVLGYTGEIPPEELAIQDDYRLGDIVGKLGVEEAFESHLRGKWGAQEVEVDASGNVLRTLGDRPSRQGNTLKLTLDKRLQQVAVRELGERKGAVIALDPRNGAVLAMASYPAYDPNIFSGRISPAQWKELQGKSFPFLNRTLRAYPPASTFKVVTASAAIESGSFAPTAVLPTFPFVAVGGWRFWDWNRAGFGPLGFEGAIAWSSDTFFYQTALRMGAKPLQEWSRRYGFGQRTGIALAGESAGTIPNTEWKRQYFDLPWYAGDTVNMSIGQGFITATPLQVAVMTAVVANGGKRIRPHFASDLEENTLLFEDIGLTSSTLAVLRRGLRAVITGGTGSRVGLGPGFPAIAGKSGTAEDPPRKSHAWFTCYGPYDTPEIVTVAFLENSGGGGSSKAGPICKAVLTQYFSQK
ncbi:MAG: penicillin-binding protein 2 [Cyanobacteria bacterium P01_D01_bin.123]